MASLRGAHVLDGLRSEGFKEPDQVILVSRGTEGDPARSTAIVNELLASKVDVLVAVTPALVRAAKAAGGGIPIVANDLESDPVESGYVASLAKPGGNITGVFLDFPEFGTKWLELLMEAIPRLSNVIALWDPGTATIQTKAITVAAQMLNVKIEIMQVSAPAELHSVYEAAAARHPDGLVITSSPLLGGPLVKTNAELALRYRLPAISLFSEFSHNGGLMSYGPNINDTYREAGVMVGKILHGAKPADLPAERPTRFELVINLKTAKELNLTISNPLQLRADEVID
jgi:putative ABC transport system substrate-binding protein